MAILSRRVEHMHQATAIAKRIPLRNPQISRNGIRWDEANAVHILGELIGFWLTISMAASPYCLKIFTA